MAKIPYTKIRKKFENNSAIPVQIGDQTISVRQYLPVNEKLKLIGDIVINAHEQDFNFANPYKVKIFTELFIIFNYTDINFTEKQKEELDKLYDELYSSNTLQLILDSIPKEELYILYDYTEKTINSIYNYQNSFSGILENVKNNYEDSEHDLKSTAEDLKKLDISELKEILAKMG